MNRVIDGFMASLAVDDADLDGALPTRLATAAGRSLAADGTVISLIGHPSLRMPIGFSDPGAAVAEELQFGVADTPALDAHRLGLPFLANPSTIFRCWPVFHRQLSERTEFRAVASLPLRQGPVNVGVLDLYFVNPIDIPRFPIDTAQRIGELVTEQLVAAQYITTSHEFGPAWLINHSTQPRGLVSVAMGIICLTAGLRAEEALALLRSHADQSDVTVDEVARLLTSGLLRPSDIRQSAPASHQE